MTLKHTDSESTSIDRRTVLKTAATGASVVGLSGVSGVVGADPGRAAGGPSEPCDGCGTLLAKYEWDEEQEAFVFEKGRESLGIDAEDFTVTVPEGGYDEDGEPRCFEFDSTDVRGTNVYEASCLTVKAGQETYTQTYEGQDYAEEGPGWVGADTFCVPEGDKYAISNFAPCMDEVFFQVDMGIGEPPVFWTDDWGTAELYDGSNYIGAALKGFVEDQENRFDSDSDTISIGTVGPLRYVENANDEPFWQFTDTDGDGDYDTVTVEFDVIGDEPLDTHLVSTETPGPWTREEIPYSDIIDMVRETLDPADNPHSFTVDLPTL